MTTMANVPKETLDKLPAAILGRAIQKAIANGWKDVSIKFAVRGTPQGLVVEWNTGAHSAIEFAMQIIFNHEFAKALWGESLIHDIITRNYERDMTMYADRLFLDVNNWQFHLQQMVIAEDPIKYLGENI